MGFAQIVTQMCILFFLIIVGYLISKLKIVDEHFDRMFGRLILYVCAPAIIVASAFSEDVPKKEDILPVLIAGTFMYLLMLVCSFIFVKVFKINNYENGIYKFMLCFGNINFIGFPVVGSIFGPYAIFYASILSIPFNLMCFTIGNAFIKSANGDSKIEFKIKHLFSPCLIGTYIAILLVVADIHVDKAISQSIILLGSITIPGALLLIGTALSRIDIIKMLTNVKIYIMAICKMFLIPLLFYYIANFVGLDIKYTEVITLLCAMPVATYGTMLCLNYGIDTKTISQGTFISTSFALISIPVLCLII